MKEAVLIGIIIVFLIVLTIILYILLNNLIKQIDDKAKSSFVLKMQEYDNLISEREKKLQELDNRNTNQDILNNASNDNQNNKVIIQTKEIEYRNEDLMKKIKEIDDKFNLDEETIIRNFLKYKTTNENMTLYMELINLYKRISSLDKNEVLTKISIEKLTSHFSKDMQDILIKNFNSRKKISLISMLDVLEIEIKRHDPGVYVLVGKKNVNYNYIDEKIKTLYDKNIFKGIKIVYHNKIYDYSIE